MELGKIELFGTYIDNSSLSSAFSFNAESIMIDGLHLSNITNPSSATLIKFSQIPEIILYSLHFKHIQLPSSLFMEFSKCSSIAISQMVINEMKIGTENMIEATFLNSLLVENMNVSELHSSDYEQNFLLSLSRVDVTTKESFIELKNVTFTDNDDLSIFDF